MIICPVRILLNTFHIFRSAGEQFLLFPGISTLGHFVPKLRNGASAPGRRQPGLGRLPNKHFGKYFSAARRKNLECVHTRIACQKRKCGYTNLRQHVESIISQRSDIYFDEQVWERVENIYTYYKDRDVLVSRFYYNVPVE